MKYGYARVSTHEQTTDTQTEQLIARGVPVAHIITEKRSGVKRRPELEALFRELQTGDELHITKLDRLGRNARELYETAAILESKGVVLVINGEPHDPRDPHKKLIFGLLAIFADFERDLIAERTKDRLDSIKAAGGRIGRKRATNPEQEALIVELREKGYSNSEIRKVANISNSVLYRIIGETKALEEEAADPSITRARRAIETKAQKAHEKALKNYANKYNALGGTE